MDQDWTQYFHEKSFCTHIAYKEQTEVCTVWVFSAKVFVILFSVALIISDVPHLLL